MRDHYQQEFYALNQKILKMGILVEENLLTAREALLNQDAELAQRVINRDQVVNDLELEIGDQCTSLIAREQPVASDLRHVVACLKVVSDVERIGDYATHIAKRAREMALTTYIKPLVDLPHMIELGAVMLRQALQSFIARDQMQARMVAVMDKEMNGLNKLVYKELLASMIENNDNIKQATKLLFLSRELERVGDHAVYICGWTVYSATGKHEDLS